MKEIMKYTLVTVAVLLSIITVNYAQKKAPQLVMAARAIKDSNSILVRWAPGNAAMWRQGITSGFILERYAVSRNRQPLEQPEYTLLTPQPIKPAPVEQWEPVAQRNSQAAIIAQAIYGKDFQVSADDSKGLAKIYNQSLEIEQRYTFSLYAADISFEAALMAGWAFVDKHIQPGVRYFYRIKTVPGAAHADSSGVLVNAGETEALPVITQLSGAYGDKTVMLTWDYSLYKSYYTSYFVEKSVDNGKSFQRLSNVPVTNLNGNGDKPSSRMYFMDSLADNEQQYQYRIRGISVFGETGPPSEMVSGKGNAQLAYVPNMKRYYIDKAGKLQLQWEFDEKGNKEITGFSINYAERENGKYVTLVKNIAPTDRKLSYEKPPASGYYTITALTGNKGSRTSFPVLVQAIDSTPPAVPSGLMAVADSNGVVTLKWTANRDKDLLGYKVFRGMRLEEELTPLVDSIWYVNKYSDTLSMRMSNPKAYYAVAALDKRYNQSALSQVVEVKKPAVIPPSPPVISNYTVKGDSIVIHWINSSDKDIQSHTLYKREAGAANWLTVQAFPGRVTARYADADVAAGKEYTYMLEVKNEAGLTARSEQLTVTASTAPSKGNSLTRLYAVAHTDKRLVEVTWDDKLNGVTGYQIYKASGEGRYALWKTIPAGEKGLYDTEVKPNTLYKYAVQALLQGGTFSDMKTVSVLY